MEKRNVRSWKSTKKYGGNGCAKEKNMIILNTKRIAQVQGTMRADTDGIQIITADITLCVIGITQIDIVVILKDKNTTANTAANTHMCPILTLLRQANHRARPSRKSQKKS